MVPFEVAVDPINLPLKLEKKTSRDGVWSPLPLVSPPLFFSCVSRVLFYFSVSPFSFCFPHIPPGSPFTKGVVFALNGSRGDETGWKKMQMQVVEADEGVRRECWGWDVRSYSSMQVG